MRFVDTNILIYSVSFQPEDTAKRAVAAALLEETDLVLSVQVLQEFYHYSDIFNLRSRGDWFRLS